MRASRVLNARTHAECQVVTYRDDTRSPQSRTPAHKVYGTHRGSDRAMRRGTVWLVTDTG
jgi:hypothetical protein